MKKFLLLVLLVSFGLGLGCTPTAVDNEKQTTEKPNSTNTANQSDGGDGDDNGEG